MQENNKILVVEDDLRSAKLLKSLLVISGYEVMVIDNAEAAISIAREKLPDLITMDHRLPGMNGEEAFKILKADEKTKNIPVVFVTASVMDDDKERLESYHCKVIIKPIDTRTFVREIEEVLNVSRG